MTGHSRGGALANLVGARLIDEGKRVFAYTFAAPAVTDCAADIAHGEKYSSIFNVINTDDFVTYFPLSQWGFTRYGRSTSGVNVSGLCQTEWNNRVWNSQNDSYNWDEHGLTDAYELFADMVSTRNDCYSIDDYSYNMVNIKNGSTDFIDVENFYPSNTKGYYRVEYGVIDAAVFQSPMFLMKYFAYLAHLTSLLEQAILALDYTHIAPYLWNIETQLVQTALGGITHPHLPDTYYLLADCISKSDF